MRFRILLAVLAFGLTSTIPAFAQTPPETPVMERSVDPDACAVTPRSVDELQEIVDRPAPDGTDIRVDVRFAPGDGQRAGDVATSQVTLVLYQLAACFNANDMLRVYALFSDSGLRPALFPEDLEAAATVTPVALDEENRFPEPVVWDVRVQQDGRVTALVDFDGEIALVTFVWDEEQERYLIDLYDDQIPQDLTPVGEED